MWFRPFWKDNISKIIIMVKVIKISMILYKIVDSIYSLKQSKKWRFLTTENMMINWIFHMYFLSTMMVLSEPSWALWYLICKIWAFSLGNILFWSEKEVLALLLYFTCLKCYYFIKLLQFVCLGRNVRLKSEPLQSIMVTSVYFLRFELKTC